MNAPLALFSVVALDCREPKALAEFYSGLTGAPIKYDDGDWVQLDRLGGIALAFQLAPDHRPPVWPSDTHPQQVHIDFDVPDIDAVEPAVLALGATVAEHQPGGTTFRVYLDPAGHPFCLVKTDEHLYP